MRNFIGVQHREKFEEFVQKSMSGGPTALASVADQPAGVPSEPPSAPMSPRVERPASPTVTALSPAPAPPAPPAPMPPPPLPPRIADEDPYTYDARGGETSSPTDSPVPPVAAPLPPPVMMSPTQRKESKRRSIRPPQQFDLVEDDGMVCPSLLQEY